MLTLAETTDLRETSDRQPKSLAVPLHYLSSSLDCQGAPIIVGIPLPPGETIADEPYEVVDPQSGWSSPCQISYSQDRHWLQATFFAPGGTSRKLLFRRCDSSQEG